jgi:5-methylthioadenosine/S-adenosylhomocysteine deaminase
MTITWLTSADILGYDGSSHRLLRNGDIVFDEQGIRYVGKNYAGPYDVKKSLPGRLIMPGFINLHCHAGNGAGHYLTSDYGVRDTFGASYLAYNAPKRGSKPAATDAKAMADYTVWELTRTGSTTWFELGSPRGMSEALVHAAGKLGVRAYLGTGIRSGSFHRDAQGRLQWEHSEAAGKQSYEEAIAFAEEFHGAYDGKIQAALIPLQADTCDPDLLVSVKQAAVDRNLRIQTHAAQNTLELQRLVASYGQTSVEYLHSLGFLGKETILGHAAFINSHPLINMPGDDLAILAESGTTVAHCPVNLSRRGAYLHSMSRYIRRGINLGLGTDTHPRDIIQEMKWAGALCKVIDGHYDAGLAMEVINAATLNGAAALGRDDLGRLRKNAQSDLVVVDQRGLHYGVVRDPVKALLECGTGADVEYVYVGGKKVVDQGEVEGLDGQALIAIAQEESEHYWRTYKDRDWNEREADEVFPYTFDIWDGEERDGSQ